MDKNICKIKTILCQSGTQRFIIMVHQKRYQKNLENFTARLEPKREIPYHKNTLKNMRAAINRYFQNNNIKVDIVNDTKFKSCNRVSHACVVFRRCYCYAYDCDVFNIVVVGCEIARQGFVSAAVSDIVEVASRSCVDVIRRFSYILNMTPAALYGIYNVCCLAVDMLTDYELLFGNGAVEFEIKGEENKFPMMVSTKLEFIEENKDSFQYFTLGGNHLRKSMISLNMTNKSLPNRLKEILGDIEMKAIKYSVSTIVNVARYRDDSNSLKCPREFLGIL
ncbi:hypothetical protein KUTeg_008706 [Tegillarca granosa]|uniref:Uncharacterized protein n=1 Tax=Tegillarca granosa TaxID=220873 RepID=A0ABQ9FEQ8_TEGGR|nr:hypothetical protein KUTeg_008706 [Tegillarca granosa]